MRALYGASAYYHGHGFCGGFGGSHWLAHTIMGSIVRGFIYRAIWSLTRGMSSGAIITLAVVAIVVVVLVSRRFS